MMWRDPRVLPLLLGASMAALAVARRDRSASSVRHAKPDSTRQAIRHHAILVRNLGGAASVAANLSSRIGEPVLPVTVRAWSMRGRIPPEYWPGIIVLSNAKGVEVDADWLMRTTPARKRPEAVQAAAA